MTLIDLFARNPFQHDIGKKAMGFDYNKGRTFICGTIVAREHRGEENAYIIESEYGKHYSGTLFENSIQPFDEKVILKEIERDNRLTIRIVDHNGVSVILEKDRKEIFWHNIDGDDIEAESLLKSYEKLLEYLGFKADTDGMYIGDGLLVLQFDDENNNHSGKYGRKTERRDKAERKAERKTS
jgi:hypothetical protein